MTKTKTREIIIKEGPSSPPTTAVVGLTINPNPENQKAIEIQKVK